MSAYIGAVSITAKGGEALRLQVRPAHASHGVPIRTGSAGGYRFARENGWHCQHWHGTPEDALACVLEHGVTPMA